MIYGELYLKIFQNSNDDRWSFWQVKIH